MIKRFIFIVFSLLVLQAQALVVNNTAGNLKDNVPDVSITDLTVMGTMDARDFYYIAENLNQLHVTQPSRIIGIRILLPMYCPRERLQEWACQA